MVALIRRQLKRTLYGQGMGRHARAEIVTLGTRSIAAIADFLGPKPFFMGSDSSRFAARRLSLHFSQKYPANPKLQGGFGLSGQRQATLDATFDSGRP
jgi:hypothetical protein